MQKNKNLQKMTQFLRYWVLKSTTKAGSGHPSSCLSGIELMTVLFFDNILKYDIKNPDNVLNDHIFFSKGHAAPLFYSLFAGAGAIKNEKLNTLRNIDSNLEGHPTPRFPYTKGATGSLGQGLSIGVGTALSIKWLEGLKNNVFVFLGDSEMAEGSIWEAIQIASFYKLNNLIAVLDVNKLGQRGRTMYGHNVKSYKKKLESFGWETIVIDGHSIKQVQKAYKKALNSNKPFMIIAKTIKGKGVKLMENKNGWHGKALSQKQFNQVVGSLGDVDKNFQLNIAKPEDRKHSVQSQALSVEIDNDYKKGDKIATRKVYGKSLSKIYPDFPEIVSLDAEVSNSTYAKDFANNYPGRFFEMFIAEQNMVGVALGLSIRGKIPFVSSFAAFLTRAFDQIRMSQYSLDQANIKFVGSHAGVSIGEDGPSQMGLEDISMFRSILKSIIFYPCDAVSMEKLTKIAAKNKGIYYIRTTRADTPVLYNKDEEFEVGGHKVLKKSEKDKIALIGAGITLHESLKAYQSLLKKGINVRVIDLYSIKPINKKKLLNSLKGIKKVITIEDHFPAGGLGEAIESSLSDQDVRIFKIAVKKIPRSGSKKDLLEYEDISEKAIIKKVEEIL
ncbi:MAG TPA: transketolase [Patescibacteria group bacterium]|nr:transketolase [Patescibacteria group bacterium]